MSDTNSELRRVIDEAAIRDVIARFGDTAITKDYDGFRRVWAEDAVWTIAAPANEKCEGIEEIVTLLHKLRDEKDFFVHFAVPGPISIDGDEATVRCVCHEAARAGDRVYYRNHALYLDRLRRSSDGWVFTRRDYSYLWLDFSPFGGDAFPLPS